MGIIGGYLYFNAKSKLYHNASIVPKRATRIQKMCMCMCVCDISRDPHCTLYCVIMYDEIKNGQISLSIWLL